MSDPFLGEIRIFAGNFAPAGWALCDGQIMPITQNTALFSLLGTMYGGNGTSNFALPNLMDRSPVGAGAGPGLSQVDVGESFGEDSVTLQPSELPAHTHQVLAAGAGTTGNPSGASWARAQQGRMVEAQYSTAAPSTTLAPTAVAPVGGGQPHNNLAPLLGVSFIIALQGIFPPRG